MNEFNNLDKINIEYYNANRREVKNMNFIEISSLPKILFSHIYKADIYQNRFSVRDHFLEISYIADGSFELEVGNKKYCAKKGDVICLLHHDETILSAKNFHCHHTVGATVDWSFSTDEQNSLILPTVTPAENNTNTICHLIDDFVHNQIVYKESKTLGATKFLELLCAIDKCNRKVQNIDIPSELLYTNRAKSYIQKNIHTCITQNSIAEHLGISPEYLCAVFKKTEGTTIMRYINKLKLEKIKTLMDEANLHMYEAAAIYGYNDPNYVSRLYKQLFGYNITDKPLIHT